MSDRCINRIIIANNRTSHFSGNRELSSCSKWCRLMSPSLLVIHPDLVSGRGNGGSERASNLPRVAQRLSRDSHPSPAHSIAHISRAGSGTAPTVRITPEECSQRAWPPLDRMLGVLCPSQAPPALGAGPRGSPKVREAWSPRHSHTRPSLAWTHYHPELQCGL